MQIKYPHTKVIPVADELHGYKIVDNYRWLEEIEDRKVQNWISEQNQLTRNILHPVPVREKLLTGLQRYLDSEKISSPQVYNDRVFYLKRHKGQNQPVLYYRLETETEEKAKLVIDPNKYSTAGITALDWWYPSDDGKFIAYGLSTNGDEWSLLHIVNVETGEVLSERIPRTRYASIAWKDETGFYYTRYPEIGQVPPGEENYHVRLFYHEIGTDYREDPLIFGSADIPMKAIVKGKLSKDKRYLLVSVQHGWRRNDLYLADLLATESRFIPLVKDYQGLFMGEFLGDELYLLTNYQAANYRVIKLSFKKALEKGFCEPADWTTIIPEDPNCSIQFAKLLNHQLVVSILQDAVSQLKVYDLEGVYRGDVKLPGLGSLNTITDPGKAGDPYIVYESFLTPPSIYRLDLENLRLISWASVSTNVQTEQFSVAQKFYTSKDGTKIPIFILHRSGIELTGELPTVLNGYGGFNVSMVPAYNPAIFSWLEHGGVFAVANLRGGSEYGEKWHAAGMRENKQNVFDDFISAAKFLIAEGYTNPAHLGIHGRSNGGLLVGAALTQAPELFQAVACGVPLLDMLRYHKFLIGALWIDEYGSPDIQEQFDWLYAYSPYHHLKEGVSYPATYFYTAASDSRVHPLHALKMAASLQKLNVSENPILLNVEFAAGHGVGKPISKLIDEQADIWSFLAWRLGLNPV